MNLTYQLTFNEINLFSETVKSSSAECQLVSLPSDTFVIFAPPAYI